MPTTDHPPLQGDAAISTADVDPAAAGPTASRETRDTTPEPTLPMRLLPRWVRCRRNTALAAVVGAVLGALTLTLFQAVGAVDPPPLGLNQALEAESDLILSVREPYLTSIAARRAAQAEGPVPFENVRVDVQPGERLIVLGDVRFMGQSFRATALMTVGVVNRRVRLRAESFHIGAIQVPIDLEQLVAEPINRELAEMFNTGQFAPIDVATSSDRLVVRLVEQPSAGGR